jgi:hypothetical protein
VVLVCAFTGNSDGEPEGFDITAERAGKPLTFGAGVHYCLGANLARSELAEAMAFLAPRMPDLDLEGDPRVRVDRRHLRARRPAAPLARRLTAETWLHEILRVQGLSVDTTARAESPVLRGPASGGTRAAVRPQGRIAASAA